MMISLLVSACVLIFGVPIHGAAVRWRAHYTPKAIRLEENETNSNNKVTNVFQMMRQVYRLEGWNGLYKGIVPVFIFLLIPVVGEILASIMHTDGFRLKGPFAEPYRLPFVVATDALEIVFFTLLRVFTSVLETRMITTPHRLPWFNPRRSLQVLFTPAELRCPWRILMIPGLALTFILESAIGRVIQSIFLFAMPHSMYQIPLHMSIPASILFVFILVVVSPALDMIKTRLSVQPNGGAPYLPVSDFDEAEKTKAGEAVVVDVVSFRPDPYVGMVDCAKSIKREEGCKTLFRLWRFHLLAVLPMVSLFFWGRYA